MTSHQPIRKLNKKVIYYCLIGLIALSVPAIICLVSPGKSARATIARQHDPQANHNVSDVKIISGTKGAASP